jgi:hypothetical protein
MEEPTMNLNFFQWIREGVRHSVLSGVADAVEQMGEAPHDNTLSSRLGDYLRVKETENRSRISNDPKIKKRLGRSLRDLSSGNAAKAE